jgi:sterol 14-demethylase
MTAYLGISGNDFILNGKLSHLNAEEIYSPLTTPVFGSDVVYDCPNAKLMEQKKFIKFGLTQAALEGHVPLIENEVLQYIKASPSLSAEKGTIAITSAMAEITIFTAGRALQGAEVRAKLTNEMANMYHDLDRGFQPINFIMPWLPLPNNQRRDAAHAKMRAIYEKIIERRRNEGVNGTEEENDMISNLMRSAYKDGKPVPDKEIAHMMITLMMAGQHSSSSAGSWIMLELASRRDVQEELYNEQVKNLAGVDGQIPPLELSHLDKLPLLQAVIKETLRCHSSITSILRKVTKPIAIPETQYVIGTDKVLLASPMMTATSDKYFPNASKWTPHRWLEKTPSTSEDDGDMVDYGYGWTSSGTRSPYIPFGAGRHRCIGEKYAYLNLGVIVATLVRQFKWSTLDGSETVPTTDFSSLFSGPKQPAMLRFEKRAETKKASI